MAEERALVKARQRARRLAVQAIYQWLMADTDASALIEQFRQDELMVKADADYFEQLVQGVMTAAGDLETGFVELLDRPLAQIDPVERAILLVACQELRHCLDVPYRVVINEAVELTKIFGATDSHRYINGVVDRMARQTREIEIRAQA